MTTKLRYLLRAYRYRYRVDPAELRFLCSSLQPGQVAVDVGCHKGAYAYWMRRRVGPGGAVFAFEPQPQQVAYLRNVFSTMRYGNVAVLAMAVSDATGRRLLHLAADSTHAASLEAANGQPDAGSTEYGPRIAEHSADRAPRSPLPAPRSLLVDVTTLDAFFAKRPRGPDLVKIDVEGHELAVLEGARRTLQAHRPTLLIECEARHRPDGDVRPVFDFLQSLGYRGSFFINGNRRPLTDFEPAVHQRLAPNSDRLPRGYVNNFVFEHGLLIRCARESTASGTR